MLYDNRELVSNHKQMVVNILLYYLSSNQIQKMQSEYQKQSDGQEQQQQVSGLNSKIKAEKFQKSVPRQFYKAKKTLTRMMNQYFSDMKMELIEKKGYVQYNHQELYSVQAAINKFITIRYKKIQDLNFQKQLSQELLYYAPQQKQIWKYGSNQKVQIIDLQPSIKNQNLKLPDMATPVGMGSNIYIFDGAVMDSITGVLTPVRDPYKINLLTGQIMSLNNLFENQQNEKFNVQIKSAIVKQKYGIFIIGGYTGVDKMISSRFSYYDIKKQRFRKLPKLKRLHVCPSGCLHNNNVFIFSRIGSDMFDLSSKQWKSLYLPSRINFLPFQFCCSISQSEILILGGKNAGKNCQNITLINIHDKTVDTYADILPFGVSSQRCWSPSVFFGHIAIISCIQASKYPFLSNKSNMAQIIYFGNRGCFVKQILVNN